MPEKRRKILCCHGLYHLPGGGRGGSCRPAGKKPNLTCKGKKKKKVVPFAPIQGEKETESLNSGKKKLGRTAF